MVVAVAIVAVALIVCRHLSWEKAVGTESDPAFVHSPPLQLLAKIMAAKHDAFVADFAITIDSFLIVVRFDLLIGACRIAIGDR